MQTLLFRLLLTFALTFIAFDSDASQCDQVPSPCGEVTEWTQFDEIRLQIHQIGMPDSSNWYVHSSRQNGDLQIDTNNGAKENGHKGTIMMVEGKWLVSKGIELTPGREIDALDAPLLSVILVKKLLSRSMPEGPKGVGREQIDFEDKMTGIQFATPSARGFIAAPWSVTGYANKNSDDSVDFDLVLTSITDPIEAVKPSISSVTFSGNLKNLNNFMIDSKMSLEGWTISNFGLIGKQPVHENSSKYKNNISKTYPKNIGDIRKLIEKAASPGEPDPRIDFAGFWKTDCTDTFGLKVSRVDNGKMYRVTFCGPGGCGDENSERKTFITGDSLYRVVSPVKIQVGREGHRETYKKCSIKRLSANF